MRRILPIVALTAMTAITLTVPAQEPPPETAVETPAAPQKPYLASEPQDLFSRAVVLAERGAIEEAKTLFKALTLAYPELPEPHINLAVLLAEEGSVEASADALEAAMYAHPLCRAAVELEFQRRIGLYSAAVLGAPAPPATAPPPAAVPPTPPEAGETRVVRQAADPCLNFRPEPSPAAAAVECLPPGTRVRWLGTAGDWSRVALRDGRVGWMAAAFLAVPDS